MITADDYANLPDDAQRDAARTAAFEEVRTVIDRYADLLVHDIRLMVRTVLPTAYEFVFSFAPNESGGWAVDVKYIEDADSGLLYDGLCFTGGGPVTGGYQEGDEWLDESKVRDKIVEICDIGAWVLGEPDVDTSIFMDIE